MYRRLLESWSQLRVLYFVLKSTRHAVNYWTTLFELFEIIELLHLNYLNYLTSKTNPLILWGEWVAGQLDQLILILAGPSADTSADESAGIYP